MVMWIIVISLIAIGLTLFIVEVVFIPGTTVVGLLGVLFGAAGIAISYKHFGNTVGTYILLITVVAIAGSLYYSFKSGAWSKFSLKSSIKSKVNEGMLTHLNIGDVGVTRSTLRPIGNADFNGKTFEVRSLAEYIEANEKVRIINIESGQIIVEKIIS